MACRATPPGHVQCSSLSICSGLRSALLTFQCVTHPPVPSAPTLSKHRGFIFTSETTMATMMTTRVIVAAEKRVGWHMMMALIDRDLAVKERNAWPSSIKGATSGLLSCCVLQPSRARFGCTGPLIFLPRHGLSPYSATGD